MEDRHVPAEQQPAQEARPLTSLNPIARMAALASQSSAQPAPASWPASVSAAEQAASSTPATQPPGRTVGKLAHVTAASLWADDLAFATWLRDNLEALGEALSVDLRDGRMPHPGLPLVMAADATGDAAVIVCELGDASDEGFGRLVRNVTASKARHAIWICGEPGEEYGASVSWLNRAVEARVSLLKVSAVTIGASAAAPMFELRVRTPRSDDDGVTASVPSADADETPPATRRVDDWLESVGARGEGAGDGEG